MKYVCMSDAKSLHWCCVSFVVLISKRFICVVHVVFFNSHFFLTFFLPPFNILPVSVHCWWLENPFSVHFSMSALCAAVWLEAFFAFRCFIIPSSSLNIRIIGCFGTLAFHQLINWGYSELIAPTRVILLFNLLYFSVFLITVQNKLIIWFCFCPFLCVSSRAGVWF